MNKARFEARRERLRAAMHQRGLDALFVIHDANRFYLSGFELHDAQLNESAGYLLVMADGKDWLFTDSRYLDAARRLWDNDRIFIYGPDAPAQINEMLRDRVKGKLGFEARAITLAFYEKFSQGLALERADGIVEELRIIKEPEEIALMERSCKLNHQLMEWVPTVLLPGRTEGEISWDIEKFFRQHGASELSFTNIVAMGPNAALPHYRPEGMGGATLTENCPVLVDVGARLDMYCSDQTRTFWVGDKPASYFLTALEQVRTAQRKAIEAMRPGMKVCDAYKTARAHFETEGVEAAFTHALGHGIGLETHEPPSLNARNEAVLKPGMIVTVEPGLYYPSWGGIRWEYMVLVTEDGVRTL